MRWREAQPAEEKRRFLALTEAADGSWEEVWVGNDKTGVARGSTPLEQTKKPLHHQTVIDSGRPETL